ncbi:MAG: autotransporter outer membrane beta-barrel domain-containing protein, partial [Elusimicrobium sp.]|nr:autotransporter outer membrane beta-barrel domain-containing protein [Elusimicrobium sp.]
ALGLNPGSPREDTTHWKTIIGSGAQFTNNSATGSGYPAGGAIINESVYLELGQDSYFYNNSASWYGGAIAAHITVTGWQPVTVIGAGATFLNNTAGANQGGAIYNENGILTLYGAAGKTNLFQGNTANYGGAILLQTTNAATPSSAFIGEGTTFKNNTASSLGGAVFNWNSTLTLNTAAGQTTLFTGNTAAGAPNDIALWHQNYAPVLNITGAGGTVEFDGGINSNDNTAAINKTSSGEMILGASSVNNNYLGAFTQNAGLTSVYSTNFFSGTDNIIGSALHFYTSNTANVLNVTNGSVDLTSAAAGSYNTLTANTWNASGAKLYINTYLDGNGTSTDKLVVNGGPAAGNTTLYVTQTGTDNASTPDGSDGILVVDVTDATSKTATFALAGGVVDTGALEYYLNHASDQNWYLKTDGALTNTADTVANMPALHLTLVKTAMTELRRRMGDLYLDDTGCRPDNVWARVYGRRLNVDEKIEADMTLFGAQAGVDRRVFSGGSSRMYAGIMGGYEYTGDIKIKQSNGFDGTGTGVTPSAGVYGVWFNDAGWFADLTAQYFWAQMKMKNISAAEQIINYDADRNFWAAGLEGGKSIPVSRTVVLTPKAQVLFANGASANHATNMADNVYYGGTQSLTAALRLQAAYLAHGVNSRWQPFAELGAYNEFMGKTDINFAGVAMKSDAGGAGFEASLGTNLRLGKDSYLFGDVSFEKGSGYRAFAANLGLRLGFGAKNCGKCRDGWKDDCPVKQKQETAPVQNIVPVTPAVVNTAPEAEAAPTAGPAAQAQQPAQPVPPQMPTIYFGFGKYNLTERAKNSIDGAADLINRSGMKFEVRGYTDKISSNGFNQDLSEKRAEAVYDRLIMSGVPESSLTYAGFGKADPVDADDTVAANARNRRAEIVPVP